TGRDEAETRRVLYNANLPAVADRVRLAMLDEGARDDLRVLLDRIESYERPAFPLRGKDLIDAGMTPGPEVSARLEELKKRWIASDFALTKESLLED
ncbi:MAG: CCA tRNA nucleotidyltransferase, partial [Pseudomonadota bacterium]